MQSILSYLKTLFFPKVKQDEEGKSALKIPGKKDAENSGVDYLEELRVRNIFIDF